MIQKDSVLLQSKIALGRPYSGDVYNAQLIQGHNKVDCEISILFCYMASLARRHYEPSPTLWLAD